jgi:hypothetical protein
MGNTIVLALLRSPLARLLGGVCELEFTRRRSGRAVRLPVQYARDADGVVVHVGRAGKRRWRTFTDPHPRRVHTGGATLVGIGRPVRTGVADRTKTERVYRRRYPKATLSTNDPIVFIEPAPDPATGQDDTRRGSPPGGGRGW